MMKIILGGVPFYNVKKIESLILLDKRIVFLAYQIPPKTVHSRVFYFLALLNNEPGQASLKQKSNFELTNQIAIRILSTNQITIRILSTNQNSIRTQM